MSKEAQRPKDSLEAVVRRWRKARPHCGGWWEYRECGRDRIDVVLLTSCGTQVEGDDEWEQATGRPAEHDGWVENYFEGTDTTQKEMPGLWRQCASNDHKLSDDSCVARFVRKHET